MPPPAYRRAGPRAARCARLITPWRDPQSWLDALHAVVRFPVAIFSFVVTVTFWSVALGGLTYGAWDWALPDDHARTTRTCSSCWASTEHRAAGSLFYTVIGARLRRPRCRSSSAACALLQAQLGRVLLTSRAATQAELGPADRGPQRRRRAEAVALRRLERDIHDGPQQRLVRLGMDLARAQRQLDRDPRRRPRPRSTRPPA